MISLYIGYIFILAHATVVPIALVHKILYRESKMEDKYKNMMVMCVTSLEYPASRLILTHLCTPIQQRAGELF